MLLRASFLLILALGTFAACGAKKGGKLMTDTPVLPFKAPDVEEISGVSDEPEPPPAEEPKAATPPPPSPVVATPAPAPAAPAKAPAAPAKAPAAPAKAPAPAKKP